MIAQLDTATSCVSVDTAMSVQDCGPVKMKTFTVPVENSWKSIASAVPSKEMSARRRNIFVIVRVVIKLTFLAVFGLSRQLRIRGT